MDIEARPGQLGGHGYAYMPGRDEDGYGVTQKIDPVTQRTYYSYDGTTSWNYPYGGHQRDGEPRGPPNSGANIPPPPPPPPPPRGQGQ